MDRKRTHEGTGILKYYRRTAMVEIDPSLVEYYYSLIPRYKYASRQKHPGHITVVRPFETPTLWNIRDNEIIEFQYDGEIQYIHPYYFLNVWSEEIGDIREALGLERFRPNFDCYHITIGNLK